MKQTNPLLINPFICKSHNCGKSFKRKDYLVRHELNHATHRSFSCTICEGFSFARRDLFEKHKKSKTHLKLALESGKTDDLITPSSFKDVSSKKSRFQGFIEFDPEEKKFKKRKLDEPNYLTWTDESAMKLSINTLSSLIPAGDVNKQTVNFKSDVTTPDIRNLINLDSDDTHGSEQEFTRVVQNYGKFSTFIDGLEDSFGWLLGDITNENQKNKNRALNNLQGQMEELENLNHYLQIQDLGNCILDHDSFDQNNLESVLNSDIRFKSADDEDMVRDAEEEQDYDDDNIDIKMEDTTFQLLLKVLRVDFGLKHTADELELILSLKRIKFFINQYWILFDPIFPIVHKPTFKVDFEVDDTNKNENIKLHMLFIISIIITGIAFFYRGKPKHAEDPVEKTDDEEIFSIANNVHSNLMLQLLNELNQTKSLKHDTISVKLLQSLLLLDIFSFYFNYNASSQESQPQINNFIYHPMIINLFKEMNLYKNLIEPEHRNPVVNMDSNTEKNIEVPAEYWIKWLHFESLKRVVFTGYLIDVQHAFFYSTKPSISTFDIQLELPYTDSVWYAKSFEDFLQEYIRLPKDLLNRTNAGYYYDYDDHPLRFDNNSHNHQTKNIFGKRMSKINNSNMSLNTNLQIPNVKDEGRWPNFLWSLRRLMQKYNTTSENNQKEYHFNCFSQFSRYIFLHGAISLVVELRLNQEFNIFNSMNSHSSNLNKFNSIAATIEQALFSWKVYFHKNIVKNNQVHSFINSNCEILLNDYSTTPLFWSNITMFHMGLLGLYCNFESITEFFHNFSKKELEKNNSTSSSSVEYLSPGRIKFNQIEVSKNKMQILNWLRSKDGKYSLKEACSLLRIIICNDHLIWNAVPHASFIMYISVLICWCFEINNNDQSEVVNISRHATKSMDLKKESFNYLSHKLESVQMDIEQTKNNALFEFEKSNIQILIKYSINFLNENIKCNGNSRYYAEELKCLVS